MASETPRTDASVEEDRGYKGQTVGADFARMLERELSECRKQLAAVTKDNEEYSKANEYHQMCVKELEKRLAAARKVCDAVDKYLSVDEVGTGEVEFTNEYLQAYRNLNDVYAAYDECEKGEKGNG